MVIGQNVSIFLKKQLDFVLLGISDSELSYCKFVKVFSEKFYFEVIHGSFLPQKNRYNYGITTHAIYFHSVGTI